MNWFTRFLKREAVDTIKAACASLLVSGALLIGGLELIALRYAKPNDPQAAMVSSLYAGALEIEKRTKDVVNTIGEAKDQEKEWLKSRTFKGAPPYGEFTIESSRVINNYSYALKQIEDLERMMDIESRKVNEAISNISKARGVKTSLSVQGLDLSRHKERLNKINQELISLSAEVKKKLDVINPPIVKIKRK